MKILSRSLVFIALALAWFGCSSHTSRKGGSDNGNPAYKTMARHYAWAQKGESKKETQDFDQKLPLVRQFIDEGEINKAHDTLKELEKEYSGYYYVDYEGMGDGSLDDEIYPVRRLLECRRSQNNHLQLKSINEFRTELEKAISACSVSQLTKLIDCHAIIGHEATDTGWTPTTPRVAAKQIIDSVCLSGKLRGSLSKQGNGDLLFVADEKIRVKSIQDDVLWAKFVLHKKPNTKHVFFDFVYSSIEIK